MIPLWPVKLWVWKFLATSKTLMWESEVPTAKNFEEGSKVISRTSWFAVLKVEIHSSFEKSWVSNLSGNLKILIKALLLDVARYCWFGLIAKVEISSFSWARVPNTFIFLKLKRVTFWSFIAKACISSFKRTKVPPVKAGWNFLSSFMWRVSLTLLFFDLSILFGSFFSNSARLSIGS